ncbi:MAG: Holliday junction resolvase RuvX [Planctomycetes bacterium]|nr:Holliday junction resolvase RuvX [Planctomycetota bacterium]
MRYLAIDYGNKRIGLAICDPDETIASPLTVIENKKPLEQIARTIESEDVDAIVIGLPLNMDDSTGPQAKLTLKFAEQLRKNIDLPIHFQDERLTSFAADEKLASAELTTKKKKKLRDAIAAAEILQAFLDQKKQN